MASTTTTTTTTTTSSSSSASSPGSTPETAVSANGKTPDEGAVGGGGGGGGGGLFSNGYGEFDLEKTKDYSTFRALRQLIREGRTEAEVMRLVHQNPTKVSLFHLPLALKRISMLHKSSNKELMGDRDFIFICDRIADSADKFDNVSVLNALRAANQIGFSNDSPLVTNLWRECHQRVDKFSPTDLVTWVQIIVNIEGPSTENPALDKSFEFLDRGLHKLAMKNLLQLFSVLVAMSPQLDKMDLVRRDASCLKMLHVVSQLFVRNEAIPPAKLMQIWEMVYSCVKKLSLNGTRTLLSQLSTPQIFAYPSYQMIGNQKVSVQILGAIATLLGVDSDIQKGMKRSLERCVTNVIHAIDPNTLQTFLSQQEAGISMLQDATMDRVCSDYLRTQNHVDKMSHDVLAKIVTSSHSNTALTVAKFITSKKLRDDQILNSITDFLIEKAGTIDVKSVPALLQSLTKLNYRPDNINTLCQVIEEVMISNHKKAPLSTVYCAMSLLIIDYLSDTLFRIVFSDDFLTRLLEGTEFKGCKELERCKVYLSRIDATINLQQGLTYTGPRLPDKYKVAPFGNNESWYGISKSQLDVQLGLQEIYGDSNSFQQNCVHQGYFIDFLLCLDARGNVVIPQNNNNNLHSNNNNGLHSNSNNNTSNGGGGGNGGGVANNNNNNNKGHHGNGVSVNTQQPPTQSNTGVAGGKTGINGSHGNGQGDNNQAAMFDRFGTMSLTGKPHNGSGDGPLPVGTKRVAVLVMEERHYCKNAQVLLGHWALKVRQLQAMGIKVAMVPYFELRPAQEQETVRAFLKERILS